MKLDQQIEDCRDYAIKQGYSIVREFKEEDYSTGDDMDLEGINKALDLAEEGAIDMLICRDMDRFARGLSKQLFFEEEFERHGSTVEYVFEQYDNTPEGKLAKNVRASVAEYERTKIAWRTNRGKRRKVRSGRTYTNGIPPYGYHDDIEEIELADGIKQVKRNLVIVPKEAEVVQEIFKLYIEGKGTDAIARHLSKTGVNPPGHTRYIKSGANKRNFQVAADAPWYGATVRNILKRRAYYGEWHYSKTSKKYKPIAVKVPAILPQTLWQEAKKIRDSRTKRRDWENDYMPLLRNLAYCSCGNRMTLSHDKKKRADNHSGFYTYYRCYKKSCNHNKYYRAEHVDKDMWSEIESILLQPERLSKAYNKYRNTLSGNDSPIRSKLAEKHNLLARTEQSLDQILDEWLAGELPERRYRKKKKQLEANMEKIQQSVTDYEAELAQINQVEEQSISMGNFIKDIPPLLETAKHNNESKADVLRRLGIGTVMSYDSAKNKKQVDWVVIPPQEFSELKNAKLASVMSRTLNHHAQ
jgi:site-specific DNA recombinase